MAVLPCDTEPAQGSRALTEHPMFDVTMRNSSCCGMISVRGTLDLATVPRLNEALEWLCRQSHHQVTIDVSGVNFIDSSGLAAFVHAHKTLTAAGGRLALAHPSRPVQRLLSLTGLDHELPTQ